MEIMFTIQKRLDRFLLNVHYRFHEGVLVIQGESGAGKSTILNCLSGLARPDEGRIVFGGQIVYDSQEKIHLAVQKRNIGYVFQNYALFPHMTVEKNILYGIKNQPGYQDRQIRQELLQYMEEIMAAFQIQHFKKRYPQNISGGEKQRVALARAIVTRPGLLLLDEPFSALDLKTKQIVYQEFLEFKENFKIPIILITHDPKESDLFADVMLQLQQGHIVI